MTSGASRDINVHALAWQGRKLQIEYEAHWLGVDRIGGLQVAHLQVRSVEPERAELPITETGYRSHFVDREAVSEAGGPVEYVRQWLDAEARSRTWREQEAKARQLSLFQ